MNSQVIAGGAALVLAVAGTAVLTTGALSKDQEVIGGNSFAAGTIDLSTTGSVPFALTAMMPGDVTYKEFPLMNAGDSALRYSMTSVGASGPLAEALQVEIHAQYTGAGNCNATGFIGYAGPLVVGPVPLGASIGGPGIAFGSNVEGDQAGDRELAGGVGELLCVKVTYPSASTGLDGQTISDVVFTLDAEQVQNNP